MNILIVDDNEVNLSLLGHLVNQLDGCRPVTFSDSTQALEWCEHHEVDMALVDYLMPSPNGIEFIEQFRHFQDKADIPVVMITAESNKDIRYQALELGANDFLNKPIDKTEFLARAKNLLALRQGQKQLSDHASWLAREVKKATWQIKAREREAILRLSRAAEFRDPETGAHLMRMASYSRHIAKNLYLPEDEQELLFDAAPMHDVGKVGIPDEILFKPGRLDVDEFAIMQQHTVMGYQILKDSDSPLLQTAAEIAMSHHEKFDGSGYPHGKQGDDIPLFGRIVAVADVFDAVLSVRPYKKAWELDRAVDLIRDGSGTHFDPDCVNAFFQDWGSVLAIRERYREEGVGEAV